MKAHASFIVVLVFVFLMASQAGNASGGDALDKYTKLNDQESRLSEYKDSREILGIKLRNLKRINDDRARSGAPPVELDILASRVANMHCVEMAREEYFSHWNMKGEKPYHRYAFAGGLDHVSENIFELTAGQQLSVKDLDSMLDDAESMFMSETAGSDGHLQNIVDPAHNAVGIGIGLQKNEFRYAQEFLNRYIQFDAFNPVVDKSGKITLSGHVLPRDTGLYAALIYGETLSPMTFEELQKSEIYNDFTDSLEISLWPWELSFDKAGGSFRLPLDLSQKKPGYYYVQLKLKKGLSSIPYRGGTADTKGTFDASGIVLSLGMKGDSFLSPGAHQKQSAGNGETPAATPSGMPSETPGPTQGATSGPNPGNTAAVTPGSTAPGPSGPAHCSMGDWGSYPKWMLFFVLLLLILAFIGLVAYITRNSRSTSRGDGSEEFKF